MSHQQELSSQNSVWIFRIKSYLGNNDKKNIFPYLKKSKSMLIDCNIHVHVNIDRA